MHTVLVIYEYLVTLSDEVSLFWSNQKVTRAAVLFFANRYLTLGYFVFNVFYSFYGFPNLSVNA